MAKLLTEEITYKDPNPSQTLPLAEETIVSTHTSTSLGTPEDPVIKDMDYAHNQPPTTEGIDYT